MSTLRDFYDEVTSFTSVDWNPDYSYFAVLQGIFERILQRRLQDRCFLRDKRTNIKIFILFPVLLKQMTFLNWEDDFTLVLLSYSEKALYSIFHEKGKKEKRKVKKAEAEHLSNQ